MKKDIDTETSPLHIDSKNSNMKKISKNQKKSAKLTFFSKLHGI